MRMVVVGKVECMHEYIPHTYHYLLNNKVVSKLMNLWRVKQVPWVQEMEVQSYRPLNFLCSDQLRNSRELHEIGFHGRAAASKPNFTKCNATRLVQWCKAAATRLKSNGEVEDKDKTKIIKSEVRKSFGRIKSGTAQLVLMTCEAIEMSREFLNGLFNMMLESETIPEEWRSVIQRHSAVFVCHCMQYRYKAFKLF